MADHIKAGAIVVVNYKDFKVIKGKMDIVRLPDGGIVIRRLLYGSGGIILKAKNLKFTDIVLSKKHFNIAGEAGKLNGFFSRFR